MAILAFSNGGPTMLQKKFQVISITNEGIMAFFVILYLSVTFLGPLNKMTSYGRISKFKMSMKGSGQNASIYHVKIKKKLKFK